MYTTGWKQSNSNVLVVLVVKSVYSSPAIPDSRNWTDGLWGHTPSATPGHSSWARWNISTSRNGASFTNTSLFINTARGSSKSRRRQGKCVVKSEMCRSRSLEAATVNSKWHTARSVQTSFPHITTHLSDSLYSLALSSFPSSPYICHHISFTFLST